MSYTEVKPNVDRVVLTPETVVSLGSFPFPAPGYLPHHGHTPLTSNMVVVFLHGLSLFVMFSSYLDTSGSSPELEIVNLIMLAKNLLLNLHRPRH